MSWRTGSALFVEVWPLLQKHIKDKQERVEFTAKLLAVFYADDMDVWDVEDVHPEIREAIALAGLDDDDDDL